MLAGWLVLSAGCATGRSASLEDDPAALRKLALARYMEQRSTRPAYAFNDALPMYLDARESAIRSFGNESPYVAALDYEIGSLAMDNGFDSKARDFLTQSVQINPNATTARLKLAEILTRENRDQEAINQINIAIAKNPRSMEARAALVNWLASHNHTAAAVKESSAIIAMAGPNGGKHIMPATKIVLPVTAAKQQVQAKPAEVPEAPPSASSILNILRRPVQAKPEPPVPEATPIIEPVKPAPKEPPKPAPKEAKPAVRTVKEQSRREREKEKRERERRKSLNERATKKPRSRKEKLGTKRWCYKKCNLRPAPSRLTPS